MEAIFRNIAEQGSWVLKVNLLFTIVFLLVTFGFACAIFYLRLSKLVRNRKIDKYKELYSDFITRYLFDTDTLSENEIGEFKKNYITTALAEKIAIKVILIFEENFKGESNEMLKKLFLDWKLIDVVEKDLKSGKWYRMARATYVASELNLKRLSPLIEKYLDAENDELRQQAMLYFIQLSNSRPLDFLDSIKKPLTLWEQIYIEECLKSNYKGDIPDFSNWLSSSLDSVQEFSIKMIGEYNQFENISGLLPFLRQEEDNLKIEAIRSLSQLGYADLIDHLKKIFTGESSKVKAFILKTVGNISSFEELREFEPLIPKSDRATQQVFQKLRYTSHRELSVYAV
ncbi:HEAT repeat domain-containing protein [Salegentibacter sp. HM20]